MFASIHFFFSSSAHPRDLHKPVHSFPTRRSSDLRPGRRRARRRRTDRSHDAPARSRRTGRRSEEHTSELQSHGLISYAVFCLKKKKNQEQIDYTSLYSLYK